MRPYRDSVAKLYRGGSIWNQSTFGQVRKRTAKSLIFKARQLFDCFHHVIVDFKCGPHIDIIASISQARIDAGIDGPF